ncbi:uncharacterized protein LOC133838392 [Drosophila sulfurigaster albostrigata]|uniref:uncharacterized protein LOC133838392 n=1 Tax=Drosophila sulfurigaster albostrigata TaxID=89887 RepID=UPI002D21EA9A|nr:uncharacterized protein LOC133838392 [Drosophila sulfurigaster albostrigata]
MLFKALSLLVVIGSVLAEVPTEHTINTDVTLLDVMMMPRGDPVLDAYCWGRYTPIMKEIIDVFEAESKQCQTDFDISNTAIVERYSIVLANISATAEESCEALLKCGDLSTQLESFNCFGTAGRDQSQKLTTMSGDSLAAAISLAEEISSITSIQNLCTEKAIARYSNDNSQALKELMECLDGNIVTEQPELTTIVN